MLWFSSMITRILRRAPSPPARLGAELPGGAELIGGWDPAGLVVARAVEGITVPGADVQPATRKLPASRALARQDLTQKEPHGTVRPVTLRAWSFTRSSLTPEPVSWLRQST